MLKAYPFSKTTKIISFLFLFPILCYCQNIPKLSNTIYVKNVSYSSVKNSLIENSYFIDQQNESDGVLITREFNADDYKMFGQELNRYVMVIFIRIKDSTAKITAKWSFTENGIRNWSTVEYWKLKTSVNYSLFMRLDKFARSLGGEVSYDKL